MEDRIYLDTASATPLDDRVRAAMEPYWSDQFGNAGMKHKEGREAKAALEEAREKVAKIIGAHPDEVVFTSGGTESNMLATVGVLSHSARMEGFENVQAVTSVLEHSSMRDLFSYFSDRGVAVNYCGVDGEGIIDLPAFESLLNEHTAFVSVMYANETIGTIQPLSEIANKIRSHYKQSGQQAPYFHTDAAQGGLFLDLSVDTLGVDLMSVNGQKIYGPKGVGILYIRRGTPFDSFYRSSQESGRRGGTESIPLIVGFATALEIAQNEREQFSQRVQEVRDYFIEKVTKAIPNIRINGHREKRLPNNLHVSVPGVSHEFLMVALDEKGIACSTKSACLTGSGGSSSLLAEMGFSEEAGLRFSLGRHTSKDDIDYVVGALTDLVQRQ